MRKLLEESLVFLGGHSLVAVSLPPILEVLGYRLLHRDVLTTLVEFFNSAEE